VGVRYSEVSTGFYGNPATKRAVHVDANADNLGKVLKADVCVHADAGLFLHRLLECADRLRRPPDGPLLARIRKLKEEAACGDRKAGKCGLGPLAVVRALRCALPEDGLCFVDVTVSEHLACEHFRVTQPRTFFLPADNQAMGWSIPASLGAQRAYPDRPTAV